MNERGQLSADFLFATFILIVVVGSLVAIISQTSQSTENAAFAEADALSHTIARSINEVYTNGAGNSLNFTLPGDFNYSVEINGGKVTVTYHGKSAVADLLVPASAVNYATMYPNETYTIYNANGTIKFNKTT